MSKRNPRAKVQTTPKSPAPDPSPRGHDSTLKPQALRGSGPTSQPVTAVECAAPECAAVFTPKRSTARYCGTTCRQRAARARRATEAAAAIDAQAETEEAAGTADAEHSLVKATRQELEEANALDTVEGQIAMQLARKLTNPDNVSPGLAKELRATLVAVKGNPAPGQPGADAEPVEVEDEVTQARRAREEARQATGRI